MKLIPYFVILYRLLGAILKQIYNYFEKYNKYEMFINRICKFFIIMLESLILLENNSN